MTILHTIYISGSNCIFENIDLEDIETRNKYSSKTPTTTLPFLETGKGNISETNAILIYLAQKYKKDLLGQNIFENAKINQWIEFACSEINNSQKSIIYPIFGWKEFCKDSFNKENDKIKEFFKKIENELENKNYLVGNRLTLADIVLFRYLRFFMMFIFADGYRNNILKNTTKWFSNIMQTNEAIKAYGRTILCKTPIKPVMNNINKNRINEKKNYQKKDEKIEKKKEVVIINEKSSEKQDLNLRPRSEFNLDEFKKNFFNCRNKEEELKKFWGEFNTEDFSLWWLEYQCSPEEEKNLSDAKKVKNSFLQKLDNLKKESFAVHGVYGTEGNYKIRGVWLWKGKDVPKQLEQSDYFDHMTIKGLDYNDKEDVELVNEYWTKLNKNDKVQRKFVVDCNYFY